MYLFIAILILQAPTYEWLEHQIISKDSFISAVFEYFGVTWIKEQDYDANQYIFAVMPHGILAISRILFHGEMADKHILPGIYGRWVAATPQFYVPGARELMLLFGAIDASKTTLRKALNRGESLFLYPGGTKELMRTNDIPNTTIHTAGERKGFIKLAIEHGIPIVPVVAFGEYQMLEKLFFPKWIRTLLYKFKIPGCWFSLNLELYSEKQYLSNDKQYQIRIM